MEEIYRWAGTIVSYLVFVTVLIGLLPAARYEKYLRLFAGCILILLVFQPLIGGLRMEDSIDRLFRSISFENEAYELTGGLNGQMEEVLGGLEEKRLELLISEYENETEEEMKRMAEAAGFRAAGAEVTVERNPERADFAGIKNIWLEIASAEESETQESFAPVGEAEAGENIHIDAVASIEVGNALPSEEREKAALSDKAAVKKSGTENEIKRLKQQIAAYYQVEEAYVEIRMED